MPWNGQSDHGPAGTRCVSVRAAPHSAAPVSARGLKRKAIDQSFASKMGPCALQYYAISYIFGSTLD